MGLGRNIPRWRQNTLGIRSSWISIPEWPSREDGPNYQENAVTDAVSNHHRGETHVNYAELQALLTEVANITNDRPIGVRSLTEEDLVPLTPNHLLLGCASTQKLNGKGGKLVGLDRM